MEKVKKLIREHKPKDIADYIHLSGVIEAHAVKEEILQHNRLKIAIVTSFTSQGIKEALLVKCCDLGVYSSFYVGGYAQYMQEILDEKSGLYAFCPDLVIIFIDTRSLFGDAFFSFYDIPDSQKDDFIQSKYDEIASLISKIKERTSAYILLHNFEVPLYSPLGILENKQGVGFIESVKKLNRGLEDLARGDSRFFIFDYDAFSAGVGKEILTDDKMYYLGDIKIAWPVMLRLSDRYLSYIKAIKALTKKCLVLDLDNTLWGGVLGEDGLDGIKLGPTPEGRPFWEFQKYILSLFKRGVILAVNSKNNPEEAVKVLREHPYMVLKEEHFASLKINWDDKVENLKSIAQELNIGLDSIVFMDDDAANREVVRSALFEVTVFDMPNDPALYLKAIMKSDYFDALQITEEDKSRGFSYAGQRKRVEFKARAGSLNDFLKGLETIVVVEKISNFSLPRISQLTQRTNQFNMTTHRYSEDDIKRLWACENFSIFVFSARDKFGDYGSIGAVIVEKQSAGLRIDTFLLSCRIIGRKIEETILAFIFESARKLGADTVVGEFIPTAKNVPAKGFYERNGFKLKEKDGEKESWSYSLLRNYVFPDCVKLIKEDKNGEV